MANILNFKSILIVLIGSWLSLYSPLALAELDSTDILDGVLLAYRNSAVTWSVIITLHATWLFWTLAVIGMVVTFGFMLFKKADLAEFFAEFIRFTLFIGFFWWLLQNGAAFAVSILDSLRQIGGEATGLGAGLTPSSIVDIGFKILDRALETSSMTQPLDSVLLLLIAVIILVILALVAINMLLLLITSWVLAYAGIFFLGFGGSKWTSDMAINYFKTVLGIATQLFVMVLIIGIGNDIITNYETDMSGNMTIAEMCIILIVAITLLVLTNKLPATISGIVTGANVGSQGIGNFGAGAAVGTAAGLATAAAVGSSGISKLSTQLAGGGSAVIAAIQAAQASLSEGSGDNGSFGPSSDSGSNEQDTSPLAEAMGGSSSGSNSSSTSFSDSTSTDSGNAQNTESMSSDSNGQDDGSTSFADSTSTDSGDAQNTESMSNNSNGQDGSTPFSDSTSTDSGDAQNTESMSNNSNGQEDGSTSFSDSTSTDSGAESGSSDNSSALATGAAIAQGAGLNASDLTSGSNTEQSFDAAEAQAMGAFEENAINNDDAIDSISSTSSDMGTSTDSSHGQSVGSASSDTGTSTDSSHGQSAGS
ncbi:P-type conjugative transfer protein TrbL, partial [Pseudoalteromonas sp. Of11M-6]|uniref:P-type conjugative transfer protein TrbL n=1 Tax=Pseudoalteromonas sp. Of11M-6 TaxID=2917754 RepID=UPI001EF6E814